MTEQYICIDCQKPVRKRQEALLCDGCNRWQHRICATGISREEYRMAVAQETDVEWICFPCQLQAANPIAESTRLSHRSIQQALGGFDIPEIMQESSIEEHAPQQYDGSDSSETTYQIITDGSQKGKEKLADSDGYTYTVKTQRANGNRTWTCSVRNKAMWCKATVLQKGTSFTRGTQAHIHPGKLGAKLATKISAEVKKTAAREIFTSAAEIVNKVMLEEGIQEATEPLEALQKPVNLARRAIRHRQKMRPAEPQDLQFEIDESHIPSDFLRKDGKRHLMFASDKMIELLSKSKTWYIDGTFKVVDDPFSQLMSIHSFVRSGDNMKQVPLMFVLMSAKREKD
ncbi:uncharacterized protein [Apostichopus japonicus]|uniref:uncharacterized protein n=1 Tax=Stichopus japonicus TaxID=307972 RepID=UPI003AB7C535